MAVAVYGGTFYWGMDQVNIQRVLGGKVSLSSALGSDVRSSPEAPAQCLSLHCLE